MSESFTLSKLIILYMLNKLNSPMTNGQISEFILEKGYTGYFHLQQALAEMTDAGFLLKEGSYNRTYYHLTDDGRQTVRYFKNNIPPAIRKDIDDFLSLKHYDLKNDIVARADYYPLAGEYVARCRIIEDGATLLDLTLHFPGKKQAEKAADNWRGKYREIYGQIIKTLNPFS